MSDSSIIPPHLFSLFFVSFQYYNQLVEVRVRCNARYLCFLIMMDVNDNKPLKPVRRSSSRKESENGGQIVVEISSAVSLKEPKDENGYSVPKQIQNKVDSQTKEPTDSHVSVQQREDVATLLVLNSHSNMIKDSFFGDALRGLSNESFSYEFNNYKYYLNIISCYYDIRAF